MDTDSSKVNPLFPKPMMVSKVIAPLKYKRDIVRAIEEMGQVEPIEVDPRLGVDEIEVEERRIQMESYRTQLDTYLDALDHSKIGKASPIEIGTREEDVQKFVGDVVEQKSKRIGQIITRKNQISERLTELESILDLLAKLERLQLGNAAILHDSKHLKSFLGTVFPTQVDRYFWEIAEITDNKYYIIDQVIDPETTAMVIFVMQKDSSAVEAKLKTLNFTEIAMPKDLDLQGIKRQDVEAEQSELKSEETALNDELGVISVELGATLLAARELVEIELQRIVIEKKMRRTSTTCVMWAWIPDKKQQEFAELMTKVTNGKATTDFRSGEFDPTFSPSYVENSEFMSGMRGLVTAFGTPGMHEIDPYPFVLFMFPILFGIMFADLGHGLILAGIGFYFRRKKKKLTAPPKGLSSFVYGGANLMIVMGLTAAFCGILMNSFFGDETILWQVGIFRTLFEHTTWAFFFKVEESAAHHGEIVIERDYFNLLIFSFILGAITILLGLAINIYQLLKYRHSNLELYAAWTLLGTYVFIILTFLFGIIVPPLVIVGVIITVLLLFGTLFIEGKAHGIDGVMLGVDHILSLMSNTFSFGRILAMNTIHFVLAWLPLLFINMIKEGVLNHSVEHWGVADDPVVLALWVVAIIIGACIVVPVETVFSTLQALRLNWVEFFGKFYKGRGIPFKPVKIFRQYTTET